MIQHIGETTFIPCTQDNNEKLENYLKNLNKFKSVEVDEEYLQEIINKCSDESKIKFAFELVSRFCILFIV